jgi:Ubiquitin carboxyl-terminal hydrolase
LKKTFWLNLEEGDQGDRESADAPQSRMANVKLNMRLAVILPIKAVNKKGAFLTLEDPPRSSSRRLSLDSVTDRMSSMGLTEDAALVDGTSFPSNSSPCSFFLEKLHEKTKEIFFLSVVWSDGWLQYLDMEEVMAVSRSATKTPSVDMSLMQCLRIFTAPEMLDEQNSWYCGNCKEHRRAMKTVKLWRLPEVLVLTLKRFEVRDGSGFGWGGGNVKIEAPVDFPINGLDLKTFCHDNALDNQSRTLYDLFAVCNHYGRMGFGHYTAFARDWCGKDLSSSWKCFDDNSVEQCSEDEVRAATRSSYILFYRRRPAESS